MIQKSNHMVLRCRLERCPATNESARRWIGRRMQVILASMEPHHKSAVAHRIADKQASRFGIL